MTDDQIRPTNPLSELMPVVLDDEGRVAGDLACVECEYNLRTLHAEGRCPECGAGVRRSVKATAETQVAWILDAKAGATVLSVAGWTFAIPSVLGIVPWIRIPCIAAFVSLVAVAVGLGGVAAFTARDSLAREGFTARKLSRWCLVLVALSCLAIVLASPVFATMGRLPAAALGVLWAGLVATMWCALLVHAGKVMRRMSQPDIAEFAGVLSRMVGFGCCAVMACLVLATFNTQFSPVVGIAVLLILVGLFMATAVLFGRIMRVLKAARHEIERYAREVVASLPDTANSAAPGSDYD